MNAPFFQGNQYFIDEKVNFFKFENIYRVYNEEGQHIGQVKQKLTAGEKILRLMLNKGMLPFKLEIMNNENQVQATINRGWTFFMSKIAISDSTGTQIGYIQQKFKFLKPTFKVFDNDDKLLAEINGDWKSWNFAIQNDKGGEVGKINKKWAGAMREIFTSADKYYVFIDPEFQDGNKKLAVLAAAVTIDMVLRESK
ncbi:MAG: scramblase [Bacteroidetes bacterium]|nr:scramblase [Bacteroidota bacterium]